MANIFDVAKYILNTIGGVSTMKLQKLCYYSQVEHLLKTNGTPLFDENFEAWANGPVSRDLFNLHKGKFIIDKGLILNSYLSNSLTSSHISSINACLEKYAEYDGAELSDKTHSESPWVDARGDTPEGVNCNKIVSKSAMAEYYANAS